MKKVLLNLSVIFLVIHVSLSYAVTAGEIIIDHQGRPQKVTYQLYVPKVESEEPLPVLVCVGGLPSGPDECADENWKNFAQENRIAILGVGFTFIEEDWPKKQSYQYAQAWSGKALLKILDVVSQKAPIDPGKLYLFGISAGAQFSVRFAQMRPNITKAVAAHAAGGYDWPEEYIPTKFLLTLGEFDNKEVTRLEFAKLFTGLAHGYGMDVELKIIPGIAHRQTETQNAMSRDFFGKILSEND